MKIKFCGAARNVTGSKHLITTDAGSKILLDCGLFQGRRAESREKNKNFQFVPSKLDAVIIGHAHIDHSGNLPNLSKSGYTKLVHATAPTDALVHYMLPDSAYIQERDAEFFNKKQKKRGLPPVEPLYCTADALDIIRQIRPHQLNKWFRVADDVEIKFVEAGHILGAALTLIRIRQGSKKIKIAYIVDLGRKNLPLLRDPHQIRGVDYAIIESTYGNREHEDIYKAKYQLADVINRTYERGGKIIIPSFAVERTQEIIYFIHELIRDGAIPKMKMFIDSPLAVNITSVFQQFMSWFDDETQQYYNRGDDPFGSAEIEYVRSVDRSKELNRINRSAIIISASGMAEAGRILHHLINNIEDSKNTIMIVGFMAQNTLGRKLADQWKEVPILGDKYKVRAEVIVSHSFSAHADRNELLDYAKKLGKVKKIFVVHGEETQALELGMHLQGLKNIGEVFVPHEDDEVELN
ncbi:MBL fold metallo-hydrolase [bacterium]|nr:MBL fold metallo-hydrolase [bacterium]